MIISDNEALLAELVEKPNYLSLILEEQMKDVQCDRFEQRMMFSNEMNFSIDKDVTP